MRSTIFKRSFSYLVVTVLVTSCYSPKSKVEEDKHPEIPEFPAFDSPDVKAVKVAEVTIGKDGYYNLAIRDNKLFVYSEGAQEMDGELSQQQHFLFIRKGKLVTKSSWKDCPHGEAAFFGNDGSLYLGNWHFTTKSYSKRKEIPYYSMRNVGEEYHDKHADSYNAKADREISELQLELQAELFGKIKTICPMSGGPGEDGFYLSHTTYLCNSNSGKPFFISEDVFDDVSLTKDGKKKYSVNKEYLEQVRPLATYLKDEQFFGEPDDEVKDVDFFKETGSIVTGNEWYSTGNHYVGSWGYSPVYMYYYDVDYKAKVIKTKVDNMHQKIETPIKVGSGWYFISMNKSETKMTIYYLSK